MSHQIAGHQIELHTYLSLVPRDEYVCFGLVSGFFYCSKTEKEMNQGKHKTTEQENAACKRTNKMEESHLKKSELRELYQTMFPEYPDIVNIAQLRQMLGVSRHLAYDLINDGSIHGIKVGNAFRIPKASVIEYVFREAEWKEAS